MPGMEFALLARFRPAIGTILALLANFIPDFDILGLGKAGVGRVWQMLAQKMEIHLCFQQLTSHFQQLTSHFQQLSTTY